MPFDQILVELQDVFGDDRRIAESAWTSSLAHEKKELRTEADVERVVRMLGGSKPAHGVPFESVLFYFWIRLPITSDRQYATHRIQCLTADNLLYFDLPKTGDQKWKLFKMSIGEFFNKWTVGVKSKTRYGQDVFKSHRNRLSKMLLRSLKNDGSEFEHTTVKDIWSTGVQPVYRIKIAGGYEITSTLNHQYMTDQGWMRLGDALGISTPFDIPDLSRVKLCVNGKFESGHVPWNKGKNYEVGEYNLSEQQLNAKAERASGELSNFWKGGVTPEIARLRSIAHRRLRRIVLRRDNFTCQQCQFEDKQGESLEIHHIVPCSQNIELILDVNNIATLCAPCHSELQSPEKEKLFAQERGIDTSDWNDKYAWHKAPRLVPQFQSIESIVYLGEQETFDIEVTSSAHNFVCNGVVVHNSMNGMSGRYRTMPQDWYGIPDDVLDIVGKTGTCEMPNEYDFLCQQTNEWYRKQVEKYRALEAAGKITNAEFKRVREIVRGALPQANMTERTATINLRSFANLQKQRNDGHAAPEMQVIAQKMLAEVERCSKIPVALAVLKENGWYV